MVTSQQLRNTRGLTTATTSADKNDVVSIPNIVVTESSPLVTKTNVGSSSLQASSWLLPQTTVSRKSKDSDTDLEKAAIIDKIDLLYGNTSAAQLEHTPCGAGVSVSPANCRSQSFTPLKTDANFNLSTTSSGSSDSSANDEVKDKAHDDDDAEQQQSNNLEIEDFDESYKLSLEDHIPFHVNKWCLLGLFTVLLFFNGQCVGNWPPIRDLLIKEKAFSWECTADDILDSDGTCNAQREALASLSSVSNAMVYIGSALAGAALDYTGPKILGVIGSGFTALGYGLLAASSSSCRMYYPGLIFLSLGIEPVMTSLFDFPFLFTGLTSTILSIFAVGRSVGFAYPIIQDKVWSESFSGSYIWLIVCIIAIIWTIVIFFFVPSYPYLSPDQFRVLLMVEAMNADFQEFVEEEENSGLTNQEPIISNAISAPPVLLHVDNDITDDQQYVPPTIDILMDNGQVFTTTIGGGGGHRTRGATSSVHSMDKSTRPDGIWHQFFNATISPLYFPWLIAFGLNCLRTSYYGASAADQLGDASDFYVIMQPLSFLPCVPFGLLADKVNVFAVIFILQTCGLLSVLLLGIQLTSVTQYLSVIFFWIVSSYNCSQNYVFNAQLFSQDIMSRLTGLAMLVGGLVSMCASPLYNFGSKTSFSNPDWVMTGTSVINLILCGGLLYSHRRKLHVRKELRRAEQTKAVDRAVAKEGEKLTKARSKVSSMGSSLDNNEPLTRETSSSRVDDGLYKQIAARRAGVLTHLWESPGVEIIGGHNSP